MKRKFLAKAITLGLMLAVPLGAQAANEDNEENYIQENSTTGAVLNVNNTFVKEVSNRITITNTGAGNAINVATSGSGNLSLTADTINITTKGNQSFYVGKNGVVNINGNKIVIGGKNTSSNYGTFNVNKDKDGLANDSNLQFTSSINNQGNMNLTSGTINFARVGTSKGGSITMTATVGDIVSSNQLYFDGVGTTGTINADNGALRITADKQGLLVTNGAEATVNTKSLVINADSRAIQAYEGGNLTINSDEVQITTTDKADFNMGIAISGGSILTFDSKTVNITGDISVKNSVGVADESSIVIGATDEIKITGDIKTTDEGNGSSSANIIGGNITIGSADSNAKITIDGDIYRGQLKNADGDVIANNAGGSVNIILNNSESSLTGNIYDKDASDGDAGSVNLEVNNGATWTTTGDSTVKEVKSNGGVIAITGDKQNVEVKNLTGSDTTIKTDSIDNKLTIDSNSSKLDVVASSKVTDSIGNDIQGGMKKLLNNIDIKDGTKETTVKAEAGAVTGETTITRDESGNTSAAVEEVNKDNAGISEMASIGLMAWRAENNDMNKRLGELRSSKGEHGVWTRMVRGQSKYGAQGIKNQYSTYQLGYDEKLSVDKHWTVGAAVSYTDASSSFTTGHGENKHTGLAVYGSYLGDNGSFVDLIAKVARLKNEFDVMGGAGKGDYETNGYSLSAEYGKRFTKDNGFWIEPQVELTYGYVGAVDYLTSNNVSVRQNGMDSLVGRIGFSVGRDIKAGNVYARASYLYDFDGETDVIFSNGVSRSFKQDLGGGWWEVGVGTNLNLSEATHLYFDVEKTYSGNVATPWQWNAGVRWSF